MKYLTQSTAFTSMYNKKTKQKGTERMGNHKIFNVCYIHYVILFVSLFLFNHTIANDDDVTCSAWTECEMYDSYDKTDIDKLWNLPLSSWKKEDNSNTNGQQQNQQQQQQQQQQQG